MSWNIFKRYADRVNRRLERRLRDLENQLDVLRCRIDLDPGLVDRFLSDRQKEEYQAVFELKRPLISVCIATYNRADLLVERAIPSILRQSYDNFELIIVGDACTDHTADAVSRIRDSRLRFVNLPCRGNYPEAKELRWMVAGSVPMNHALQLAQGHFITHLDDDDEHAPNRLERLLDRARRERAELVWHPFHYESQDGEWHLEPAEEFGFRRVTTSSVFYHRWLRQIPWDLEAWRLQEPGDWNRFRKFKYLGIKAVRHPEPLLRHYRERAQRV